MPNCKKTEIRNSRGRCVNRKRSEAAKKGWETRRSKGFESKKRKGSPTQSFFSLTPFKKPISIGRSGTGGNRMNPIVINSKTKTSLFKN